MAMVLMSSGLNAQKVQVPPCMGEKKFAKIVKDRFNETLKINMISEDGKLMSIYVSPRGSYTMAFTSPGKLLCMLQTGTGFMNMEKEV